MAPPRKYPSKDVRIQHASVRYHDNGLVDVRRQKGKYFQTATSNKEDSRFLQLPAELRNRIYEYVFSEAEYDVSELDLRLDCLALLRVCRQIYDDAAILAYQYMTVCASNPPQLAKWLEQMLPVRRECIEHIKFNPTVYKSQRRREIIRRCRRGCARGGYPRYYPKLIIEWALPDEDRFSSEVEKLPSLPALKKIQAIPVVYNQGVGIGGESLEDLNWDSDEWIGVALRYTLKSVYPEMDVERSVEFEDYSKHIYGNWSDSDSDSD